MFFRRNKKQQQKLPTIGRWTLVKQVGSGATSKVYYGVDNTSGMYVAVKIFNKANKQMLTSVQNEVQIQSAQNHDNLLKVVEFHETVAFKEFEGYKEASKEVSAVVLELAEGGDILDLMQKIHAFPEKLARTYFHQLISGIEHLNSNNVCHRDIKPENLLLDHNFCIKIADFGYAIKTTKPELTQPNGTSTFYTPELHAGAPYRGLDYDLFAAAIVTFGIVVGHMPFSRAKPDDILYKNFVSGKAMDFWKTHEEILGKKEVKMNINPQFKDLMSKMLSPIASNRPSISAIKNLEWFNGPIYKPEEMSNIVRRLTQPKNS